MTVNAVMGDAQAGHYATSRRGGVAEDAEFIAQKVAEGLPVSQIARMVRRNVEDVRMVAEAVVRASTVDYETLPRAFRKPEPKVNFKPMYRVPQMMSAPDWAHQVIRKVAHENNLFPDELFGASRKQRVSHPRQQAFYELYITGRCSLPQIGSWFSKDHTTVLHGVRAHCERVNGHLADLARNDNAGAK